MGVKWKGLTPPFQKCQSNTAIFEIWAKRRFSTSEIKFKRDVRWKALFQGLQRWKNVFTPSTRSWVIAEIPKIKKPPLLDFRLFPTFRNSRPIFREGVSNERSCHPDEKLESFFLIRPPEGANFHGNIENGHPALHNFRAWQIKF